MTNSGFVQKVNERYQKLSQHFDATPLQYSQYLSDKHRAQIWLKREDLSPVRSYKIRGAYSFFLQALETQPDLKHFVCASAGNHAQGFAHACKTFQRKGVIFMPVTTPQQKIMKTTSFGAPHVEIRLVGDGFDAAYKAAMEYCEEVEGKLVPPFDDPAIMVGQASVAKELVKQYQEDISDAHIILPVGGGGLASGMTHYLTQSGKTCNFTFVEPDLAPSLHTSLSNGQRVALDQVDNFVDGAAVAQIGANNFEILKAYLPEQVVLAPTDGSNKTDIYLSMSFYL